MSARLLSRRRFLRLLALVAGGPAFAAEKPKPGGDNGIGGTGYAPGDNGIGGTGFIGTIRKFGSVWVNGERIAYPADVRIRIDGEAAPVSRLSIGQVARLVAERRDGGWTTSGINVVSEVVGPIDRIEGKRLEALGQSVELSDAKAKGLKVGDRVAVSGLRRPDGTIVASLVEKRETGSDQIAGVLTEERGAFRIGGQSVTGVGPGVVGERIVVRGAMANGAFAAKEVKLDSVASIGVERVSVETWVSERNGVLMTAGGVRVENGLAALTGRRVVIEGELGPNGALIARQVAFPNRSGRFDPPRGRPGGGGANGGGGLPGMMRPGGGGAGPGSAPGFRGGAAAPSEPPLPVGPPAGLPGVAPGGFGPPAGFGPPGGFGGPAGGFAVPVGPPR